MIKSKSGSRLRYLLLILIALLIVSHDSTAANSEYVYELPAIYSEVTSARAMGMGGAYQAISNDGGALRHNPAGLAKVKRIEFAGSMISFKRTADVTSQGIKYRNTTDRSRLSALSFVYPFPTFQGSMVVAAGYAVPWMEDRINRRRIEIFSPAEAWDQETYEDGRVGEWSGAFAIDVAPQISVGLRTSIISGNYYTDRRLVQPGNPGPRLINDFEISGFTGAMGVLAKYNKIRFGATIELPRWIKWKSQQSDGSGFETSIPSQKIDIPFSFTTGIASTWSSWLLTADLRFTDWTQIEYGNPPRPIRFSNEDTGTDFAYRQTLDLHLGFEYLLDRYVGTGLRLRGGFAYEPVPYDILLHTYDPYSSDDDLWQTADYTTEKTTWSLGLGLLIQSSMTIDLAYATSSYTREIAVLSEDHSENKLLVSMAFRAE